MLEYLSEDPVSVVELIGPSRTRLPKISANSEEMAERLAAEAGEFRGRRGRRVNSRPGELAGRSAPCRLSCCGLDAAPGT